MVASAMEQMIAEEYPRPGDRLPQEVGLAERFGISRIVIREAVKIPEDRGLVQVRAGRGTCTASFSREGQGIALAAVPRSTRARRGL
jgi:GntR family transcriptional repressor for pyruvate dehydrogenase complex